MRENKAKLFEILKEDFLDDCDFGYEDDWYCSWDCNCYSCLDRNSIYEYVALPETDRFVLNHVRGIPSIRKRIVEVREIDMDSIYSGQSLRNNRLDEILGLTVDKVTRIGDICDIKSLLIP